MAIATRYHDISYGHRVVGHEGMCRHLHGHNMRVHFTCAGEQDNLGRVLDFGVVKSLLCNWLEENWDHKFLAWEHDDLIAQITGVFPESIVWVPFNPTAENLAKHLVERVGPHQLDGTGVELIEVTVEETRKCSATYKVDE